MQGSDRQGDPAGLTRVAVVSDVHSNLEALEKVLSEVGNLDVYCLGDLVGYGANPNEVVDLLRERKAVSVMGNHDYAAVTADTRDFNARAAMSALWTTRELTGKNLAYLQSLPSKLKLRIGGAEVFLTHGSPDDALWEYVRPDTHSRLFAHYLTKLGVRVVGLGHTHVPFVSEEAEGTVFNPGSVGQPRDGDRRASYATLSFGEGTAAVEIHRIEYDCEAAATKIRKAGLPEQNAARLSVGR